MGRKKTTGLFKKRGIWQIDKQIFGRRIRLSTGTTSLAEAEIILARRVEELRQVVLLGARETHTFDEAVARYLDEKTHKASLADDVYSFQRLKPYFAGKSLESIHMGSLKAFIDQRKREGVKHRTINKALQAVRHLLNLAASEWVNESGQPWLLHAPKIRLLKEDDKRPPYPLSWEEQRRLLAHLPTHLQNMLLFKVNTGCRDRVVCGLQWQWEQYVPELNTSVFLVPSAFVKNREDRLVILNHEAKRVIELVRGQHPQFVFTYRGQPIKRMNNSGWKAACRKAQVPARVHDLKHTFGRRLRAAGVSLEDRQDLLGHKSGRITTHYSAAEVDKLIDAAHKVCGQSDSQPTLTLLRRVTTQQKNKTPTISPPGGKNGI